MDSKNLMRLPQITETDALKREVSLLYLDQAQVIEERDRLIALLIMMATALELPAGITTDSCTEMREIMHVAVVTLPTGQISWHISSLSLPYFSHVPQYRFEVQEHASRGEQHARMEQPFSPDWSIFSDVSPFTINENPTPTPDQHFYDKPTIKSKALVLLPLFTRVDRVDPNTTVEFEMPAAAPSQIV